jgi:hypothetical protein
MACTHKRIISTNGKLSCLECGAELPEDILLKQEETKPKKPTKKRSDSK